MPCPRRRCPRPCPPPKPRRRWPRASRSEMEFLIVLAILLVVVLFVTTPLRRARMAPVRARVDDHATLVEELEAAREAKYREIRDAELDHQMGKLSDADYEVVDRALRGEAVEIMRALDGEQPATIEHA